MPESAKIVVFDLGGVLARICHTWEEAMSVAQIRGKLDPTGKTDLSIYKGFDAYQADEIDWTDYVNGLASFAGCTVDEAVRIHNGIIQSEYSEVGRIVQELEARGFQTGCLSNTNAPHWEHLAIDGSFPAIRRLAHKLASHEVKLNKPDERIYRMYEETFGFSPHEIVYFDDMPKNVEAGVKAGWRAHRIDPTIETAPQIQRLLVEEGVFPGGVFA